MTFDIAPDPGIGIGSTADLNLRVSVANLVKLTFIQPKDQRTKLALERTATVMEDDGGHETIIRVKPFGGGVQIDDLVAFRKEVGEFHFDSQSSWEERDFRIYINSNHFAPIIQFCRRHLLGQGAILESSPSRELVEEFYDTLGIELIAEHYQMHWSRIVVQGTPLPSGNPRSKGHPTVRVYSIHDVQVVDPEVIRLLINSCRSHYNEDLIAAAERAYLKGKSGRANAVLVLDYDELVAAYPELSWLDSDQVARFKGYDLEASVFAVLDGVDTEKYRYLSIDDH
jgi:hypothetical protein